MLYKYLLFLISYSLQAEETNINEADIEEMIYKEFPHTKINAEYIGNTEANPCCGFNCLLRGHYNFTFKWDYQVPEEFGPFGPFAMKIFVFAELNEAEIAERKTVCTKCLHSASIHNELNQLIAKRHSQTIEMFPSIDAAGCYKPLLMKGETEGELRVILLVEKATSAKYMLVMAFLGQELKIVYRKVCNCPENGSLLMIDETASEIDYIDLESYTTIAKEEFAWPTFPVQNAPEE